MLRLVARVTTTIFNHFAKVVASDICREPNAWPSQDDLFNVFWPLMEDSVLPTAHVAEAFLNMDLVQLKFPDGFDQDLLKKLPGEYYRLYPFYVQSFVRLMLLPILGQTASGRYFLPLSTACRHLDIDLYGTHVDQSRLENLFTAINLHKKIPVSTPSLLHLQADPNVPRYGFVGYQSSSWQAIAANLKSLTTEKDTDPDKQVGDMSLIWAPLLTGNATREEIRWFFFQFLSDIAPDILHTLISDGNLVVSKDEATDHIRILMKQFGEQDNWKTFDCLQQGVIDGEWYKAHQYINSAVSPILNELEEDAVAKAAQTVNDAIDTLRSVLRMTTRCGLMNPKYPQWDECFMNGKKYSEVFNQKVEQIKEMGPEGFGPKKLFLDMCVNLEQAKKLIKVAEAEQYNGEVRDVKDFVYNRLLTFVHLFLEFFDNLLIEHRDKQARGKKTSNKRKCHFQ